MPVWFDVLNGGDGDSPTYVPQFEAFAKHASLAAKLPLDQVIVVGDRKMPTLDNQLALLRVSYIGPVTMQEHHRQILRERLSFCHTWQHLPYVAQRDTDKDEASQTVYRGIGHTLQLTEPESGSAYPVRHLYIHSSTLADVLRNA